MSLSRADFLRLTVGGTAFLALASSCGDVDGGGGHDAAAPDGPGPDGSGVDGPPDAPVDGGPDGSGVDAPDAPVDGGPSTCLSVGTTSSISANHGHSLTVSAADVQAGTPRSYDIQGAGTHSHLVSLTASHFAQLAQGQSVQVTSTLTGHTHTVTISCA